MKRTEWGVRVGTWPPHPYQDRRLAEYYAARPFEGFAEYPHVVVSREVDYGEWHPASETHDSGADHG